MATPIETLHSLGKNAADNTRFLWNTVAVPYAGLGSLEIYMGATESYPHYGVAIALGVLGLCMVWKGVREVGLVNAQIMELEAALQPRVNDTIGS